MTKKAISLSEFSKLSIELQLDILQQDGAHVGKRRVESRDVILFQLYGFYVEVYYRKYRKEVDRILCSDSADILQPYLGQIRIRDLDTDGEKGSDV